MKILAIETSCDETAISIVDAKGSIDRPVFSVLAHKISSQIDLHAKYGGVVPNLARREHGKNITPLLLEALSDAKMLKMSKDELSYDKGRLATILHREPEVLGQISSLLTKIKIPKIDLITVTEGPGLEPALWVGINFAQALAELWDIPVLGTNHMEGHIASPLLVPKTKVTFPALALLISGGHTELVLVKKGWKYKKIGQTRDDAVGEAFDKVARLLGLPYPGGPQISRLALEARTKKIKNTIWNLPRPMSHSGDLDFSFSGIKTSVLYAVQKHGKMNAKDKKTLACEFEDAVIEVLISKTFSAIKKHKVESLIIGGGVIGNQTLRLAFAKALADKYPKVKLLIPEFAHSTDNATMIAVAGYLQTLKGTKPSAKIKANGNLSL